MNLDHLVSVPIKISGHIVSVKPLSAGFSFIIKSSAEKFGPRRYVSDNGELLPPATALKAGHEVMFLPGTVVKGKMPRAHQVELVRKTDN
jgi:hypothetical protein